MESSLMEPENCENASPSIKRIQMWSDGETRLLLDRYGTYLPEIGSLKKFRSKKEMWAKISLEIEGRSAKQCEERYNTVIKRKKAAIENNHTSGAKRQHVEFEEELNHICTIDDSIEPEVQLSSQKMVKKIVTAGDSEFRKSEKKKVPTIQETLLEIAERKEEAREKRHREKMESASKIHDLLSKMLEEKPN